MYPELDRLMANAWRPEVEEIRGGWRFRWTRGITRRANSALAVGGAIGSLTDPVEYAEGFYEDRQTAPLVSVSTASAPDGLRELLRQRGYVSTAPTLVQTALTADVVSSTSQSFEVLVSESMTERWFDVYRPEQSGEGRDDPTRSIYRDTLLAPDLPTDFVSVVDGVGDVVGVVQVVTEKGWAGVQCMTTRPAHRDQHVGRTALNAAARCAAKRGADRMYLAVMNANAAARGLYESAGFVTGHEYEYFTLDTTKKSSEFLS